MHSQTNQISCFWLKRKGRICNPIRNYRGMFYSDLAYNRSRDGPFFVNHSHISPKEYSKKLYKKQLLSYEQNEMKLKEDYSKEKGLYDQLVISSYTAKREYKEKKNILFVDIRSSESLSSFTIDNFAHIPFPLIRRKASVVIEKAKALDTKNIYFLDSDGCDSKLIAAQFSTLDEFSEYQLRAIEGGIFEWFNDLGPVNVESPLLREILEPLQEGLKTKPGEHIDISSLNKLAIECGMNFEPHEVVYQDPTTMNTIENNFDFDRDFLQKINLEESASMLRKKMLKKL